MHQCCVFVVLLHFRSLIPCYHGRVDPRRSETRYPKVASQRTRLLQQGQKRSLGRTYSICSMADVRDIIQGINVGYDRKLVGCVGVDTLDPSAAVIWFTTSTPPSGTPCISISMGHQPGFFLRTMDVVNLLWNAGAVSSDCNSWTVWNSLRVG
jgi:hypothetical protein